MKDPGDKSQYTVCLETVLRTDLAQASVIWITVSMVFVVVDGETQQLQVW